MYTYWDLCGFTGKKWWDDVGRNMGKAGGILVEQENKVVYTFSEREIKQKGG